MLAALKRKTQRVGEIVDVTNEWAWWSFSHLVVVVAVRSVPATALAREEDDEPKQRQHRPMTTATTEKDMRRGKGGGARRPSVERAKVAFMKLITINTS